MKNVFAFPRPFSACALTAAIMFFSQVAYGQKHGVDVAGAEAGRTPAEIDDLAAKLINTGVQWVKLSADWVWLEHNPTGSTYWGPRVPRYHDYYFDLVDRWVADLQGHNITIVMQLSNQPGWAGGSGCDTGADYHCAVILNSYKASFRDNFYDLAYHMAERYPQIKYWLIGNEPNTDQYFSPQTPLLYQSAAAEYMDLLMTPATDAIKNRIPDATVFGPELFTCFDSGDSCTQNDRNWGYSSNWVNDWARTLLINWPQNFPTFTIHNYSSSDWGIRTAVGALWDHAMVPTGTQRQIWTTEFNFNSGTCGNSESQIADWTCKNYKHMTWERAFYFDLQGNGCFSLVTNDPGHPIKPVLYPAFQSIVLGSYYCE
jgi:hypothetical protein